MQDPRGARRYGTWLLPALLLLACGGVELRSPELTSPGWQDGEVSVYSIVRRDTTLFRRTVTIEFDEASDISLVLATSVIAPERAEVFLADSTTVAMKRFSLKPAWSYREVSTDVSASEVFARYEEGRVTIRKQTIEGEEERTLRLPADCYSAEALPVVLRGLPLEPGRSWRVSITIPIEFRIEPVDIAVLGTKRVETGLGPIICREVEMVQSKRRLVMAYELAEPHRLVLIRDAANETETMLSEYTAAAPDTAGTEVIEGLSE